MAVEVVSKKWSQRLTFVDRTAVLLSNLCALHCGLTPILIAVAPFAVTESVDKAILRVLLTLGIAGVGTGVALHRNTKALYPLGLAIALAVTVELLGWSGRPEILASLAISALLIAAHTFNASACASACHHCGPGHWWAERVLALGKRAKLTTWAMPLSAAVLTHSVLFTLLTPALSQGVAQASPPSALAQLESVDVSVEPVQVAEAATPEELPAPQPGSPPAVPRTPSVPVSHAAPVDPAPEVRAAVSSAPVSFDDVLLGADPKAEPALAATSRPTASGLARTSTAPVSTAASTHPAVGKAAPDPVDSAGLGTRPAPPAGLAAAIESHYPRAARMQNISGQGRARLLLGSDGRVVHATPVSETPAGHGFAAACAQAMIGSRWSPPLDKSGERVSTWLTFTCHFEIRY